MKNAAFSFLLLTALCTLVRAQNVRPGGPRNWVHPVIEASGFCESQHGGKVPWAVNQTDFKDHDSGRYGLGPRGYVKASGSWSVLYTWSGTKTPPSAYWKVVYSYKVTAVGTGAVRILKVSGRTYTGVGHVIQGGRTYYLQISAAGTSAEVDQTSNLSPWSGTVDIQFVKCSVVSVSEK